MKKWLSYNIFKRHERYAIINSNKRTIKVMQ